MQTFLNYDKPVILELLCNVAMTFSYKTK